jgi:hypothetical protein
MYKSTVPFINIAPIEGFELVQPFPWQAYEHRIAQPDTDLRVTWTLMGRGQVQEEWSRIIRFRDGKCQNPAEAMIVIPPRFSQQDWNEARVGGFLETTAACEGDTGMHTMIPEVFYSVFRSSRPTGRPIYSDGNLKFANRTIIQQIASVGEWCESFPTVYVDPARDTDMSIAAINPYPRDVVISVSASGTDILRKVKVPTGQCVRIPVAEIIQSAGGVFPWTNTLFVSGSNRVVLFFVSHSHANPSDITAIEHSEPFRGDSAGRTLGDIAMSRLYKWKKKHEGASLDTNRLKARASEQVATVKRKDQTPP